MGDEIAGLREEMRRLSARVGALEPNATIVTSRGADMWRRRMILVGVGSSLATAALIFGALGVRSMLRAPEEPPFPPQPVVQAPPPPPPPVTALPVPVPPASVAAAEPEDPPPPPPPKAIPHPRSWFRHTGNPYQPDPLDTGSNDDQPGSLTVICLPTKCDSIIDNGTALGPGHIFSRPTPAGKHTLKLHSSVGEKTITVDVPPGRLRDVRVNLAPDEVPNPYM